MLIPVNILKNWTFRIVTFLCYSLLGIEPKYVFFSARWPQKAWFIVTKHGFFDVTVTNYQTHIGQEFSDHLAGFYMNLGFMPIRFTSSGINWWRSIATIRKWRIVMNCCNTRGKMTSILGIAVTVTSQSAYSHSHNLILTLWYWKKVTFV